jgi:hypothetical protein
MTDETLMSVTVEIEPKLYEIWKMNADRQECSLADYLKQLVLCAERHELPMMELLNRSLSIEVYSQSILDNLNALMIDLHNLKDNYEFDNGELPESAYAKTQTRRVRRDG